MASDAKTRLRSALHGGDAHALRQLLTDDPEAAALINEPVGDFGARPMTATHDRAMLEVLLDYGADPNLRSDWNEGPWAPLDDADEDTARMLIERGATMTPHVCAAHGWTDELTALLDADPKRIHEPGGDGKRPLHFAKNATTVDLLIERFADVD
ncbi:MAG: hypothetical protein AAGK78_13520, partial [Planctomycetota bacterium]